MPLAGTETAGARVGVNPNMDSRVDLLSAFEMLERSAVNVARSVS